MMPLNAIVLALAAGLISAVVFASATTGPVLLRIVLFFLTPLSLYLAGLGLGPRGAAVAAIAAILIILLLANPSTAVVYSLSTAVPAVVLTRSALLSRGEGGDTQWYPVGRLVMTAALFGGVFTVLALLMLGSDADALAKTMRSLVEAFVKTELPNIPGAQPVTEAQIDDIAAATLKTLPWALGMLTMATMLLNLWLAGRITLASGRLTRPWPNLSAAALPAGAIWALLAAVALTFAGGAPGLLAGGFAGALTAAFAIIGLSVAHVVTEGSPWRSFTLAFVYCALLFVTAGAALVLACVGVADTIFAYRARGPTPPPKDNDN
ncbi:MAG: DUF2232 domain-containing protein [Hyphomicrobium sp.]